MKRIALSVLLAGTIGVSASVTAAEGVALVSTVSSVSSQQVPDPVAQVRDVVRRLRSNDLAGVVEALVPPQQLQLARAAYDAQRSQPVTDAERAKFSEASEKFTAEGAVDAMMAELEPKLEEARPKLPGAIMMGMGALNMAIESAESELTEDDRAGLRLAMPEIQTWVSTTNFLDVATLRQALTLLTDTASSFGIDSIEEFKALSFSDALAHGGTLLAASKQAITLYGLDIDAIVDSLQVELISTKGDTARVRVTVLAFDAPFSREVDLLLVNGRWYPKHAMAHSTPHADADTGVEG